MKENGGGGSEGVLTELPARMRREQGGRESQHRENGIGREKKRGHFCLKNQLITSRARHVMLFC